MTTFFFSLLCTAVLGAGTAAQSDTLTRYVIDKQDIENFDGSQLKGVRIESYDIMVIHVNGQAVRVHNIQTDRGNLPLILIDGEPSSPEDMGTLDPAAIASIQVFKNKEAIARFSADETYARFAGSAGNGVIVVTCKQPGTYTPSTVKITTIRKTVDPTETR